MSSNINQFKLEAAIGEIAGSFIGGENIVSCIYNPDATSTNRLVAGESVKLANPSTSEAEGNIYVDERSSELEAIFGTVVKSAKQKEFKPGETVKIAVSGAIMRLKASGALNRGVGVTPVLATPGSIKAVSTKAPYGVTLDKIADTAIGRVWIQADALSAGTV